MRKWLKRLLKLAAGSTLLFVFGGLVFRWASPPIPLAFAPTPDGAHHPTIASGLANYARPEQDTFYTCPEWYIVWSYQAKADYQRTHLPSSYPFLGDIGQYWRTYSMAYAATRRHYPFAGGEHVMLIVIGSSFTAEYALKGLYEKTIGWLSEKSSHGQLVAEDAYAAQVAESYAAFVHIRPFYEYSFWNVLRHLWRDVPFTRTHVLRSMERRAWFTLDYGVESLYCEFIQVLTHLTYGYEDTKTAAWIDVPPEWQLPTSVQHVELKHQSGEQALVEIPRYQEFTPAALAMVNSGARFRQIAGNELIVISALAPGQWRSDIPAAQLLLGQPILSEQGHQRIFLLCPVNQLHAILPAMQSAGVRLEHIYDY